MRPRVAVLDCGAGNLRSVEKALARVGAEPSIVDDGSGLSGFDALLLPGVGAFGSAMEQITARGLEAPVRDAVSAGLPLLGICLGLQLLFDRSAEGGQQEGLGIIPGTVKALDAPGLKLPHIGWERVLWQKDDELIASIGDGDFYFVHGYAPVPDLSEDVLGTATYGEEFCCAVARPPVWGVQFHPEKSSLLGLALLERFVEIARA